MNHLRRYVSDSSTHPETPVTFGPVLAAAINLIENILQNHFVPKPADLQRFETSEAYRAHMRHVCRDRIIILVQSMSSPELVTLGQHLIKIMGHEKDDRRYTALVIFKAILAQLDDLTDLESLGKMLTEYDPDGRLIVRFKDYSNEVLVALGCRIAELEHPTFAAMLKKLTRN